MSADASFSSASRSIKESAFDYAPERSVQATPVFWDINNQPSFLNPDCDGTGLPLSA
jgi:hypothetical protein